MLFVERYASRGVRFGDEMDVLRDEPF